jgi:hypothetical protein
MTASGSLKHRHDTTGPLAPRGLEAELLAESREFARNRRTDRRRRDPCAGSIAALADPHAPSAVAAGDVIQRNALTGNEIMIWCGAEGHNGLANELMPVRGCLMPGLVAPRRPGRVHR